jgi:hypothetical protein
MGFLVFCDVDTNGEIISYIAGSAVIPSRQYDYFFYLENQIEVPDYKVENGQLVLK